MKVILVVNLVLCQCVCMAAYWGLSSNHKELL